MIETHEQHKDSANRAAALNELITSIQQAYALGIALADTGRLTNEDVKDLGGLDDAMENLRYTRRQIEADMADYEEANYGGSAA